mgnify:CR=1 FL=1
MNNTSKINLIYIASTGRSGSTLLELILGMHPKIVNVGEIQAWPKDILEGGFVPCGCGKSVRDCPFWKRMFFVENPFNQEGARIDFFREHYNYGKPFRPRRLIDFRKNNKFSGEISKKVREYAQNNAIVFQAYLKLFEKENGGSPMWVVDSSKDPYRLMWLERSGLFNIKVIHLIKDPRAFAYSMFRHLSNNEKRGLQGMKFLVKKTISWIITNRLISKMRVNFLNSSEYKCVKYEDLASKPEKTMNEVFDFIGLKLKKEFITDFRKNKNHTIAGNKMRSKKEGMYFDVAWKTKLPSKYQKMIRLLTRLEAKKYGYFE